MPLHLCALSSVVTEMPPSVCTGNWKRLQSAGLPQHSPTQGLTHMPPTHPGNQVPRFAWRPHQVLFTDYLPCNTHNSGAALLVLPRAQLQGPRSKPPKGVCSFENLLYLPFGFSALARAPPRIRERVGRVFFRRNTDGRGSR